MMLAGLSSLMLATSPQASIRRKILRYGSVNSKQNAICSVQAAQSACVADSVCESLLRWTEDSQACHMSVKKIPTFGVRRSYSLKCELKEGIKFHDGYYFDRKGY